MKSKGNVLAISVSALTTDRMFVVLMVYIGRHYVKRGLQKIMTLVKIKKKNTA